MKEMFSNCHVLTSLNIGHFKTRKVINMEGMFEQNRRIKYLNTSNFDTSNVESMESMFIGLLAINYYK
jgi:surface protein